MVNDLETSITWLDRLVRSPQDSEWKTLVEIYTPLIARWCQRAGIPAIDAEDLTQDVLMVVVRRVHEFKHQHVGAFRGWLRSILANHLKRYFREHAEQACPIELDDVRDSNSHLSHAFDREHDEYLVRRAMKIASTDFSETTWTAFHEQVVFGKGPRQVAEQLQITINAVIKARSRVLKRIRKELQHLF